MAEPTGFEPAISGVTGRRVRPLHHGSANRVAGNRLGNSYTSTASPACQALLAPFAAHRPGRWPTMPSCRLVGVEPVGARPPPAHLQRRGGRFVFIVDNSRQ